MSKPTPKPNIHGHFPIGYFRLTKSQRIEKKMNPRAKSARIEAGKSDQELVDADLEPLESELPEPELPEELSEDELELSEELSEELDESDSEAPSPPPFEPGLA